MHPGGILLPDVAALGEADAVQLARIRLQPQGFAASQLGHAFRHAQRQAVRVPPRRRRAWRGDPAPAQRPEPRVGGGAGHRIRRPVNRQRIVRRDRDRAAEAIHRQPPRQRLGLVALDIEKDVVAVAPHDHVEQRLALRRQQPRPYRQRAGHVVGQQPLQKAAHIVARQPQQGAVGQHGSRGGIVHARKVGGRATGRKSGRGDG